MSDSFIITKTEKETETKKTITIDIKRAYKESRTISGDIDAVVNELKQSNQE